MRPAAAVILAVLVGFGGGAAPDARPEPASSPSSVGELMHGQFRKVAEIHRALIVDDLRTARARARELAAMPSGTGDWEVAARLLRAEAEKLKPR